MSLYSTLSYHTKNSMDSRFWMKRSSSNGFGGSAVSYAEPSQKHISSLYLSPPSISRILLVTGAVISIFCAREQTAWNERFWENRIKKNLQMLTAYFSLAVDSDDVSEEFLEHLWRWCLVIFVIHSLEGIIVIDLPPVFVGVLRRW